MSFKNCSSCGRIKEKSYFYKNRSKSDGLQAECKDCQKIRKQSPAYKNSSKKYRGSEKGKKLNKEAFERWKMRNPDKLREHWRKSNKIFRAKHPEIKRARQFINDCLRRIESDKPSTNKINKILVNLFESQKCCMFCQSSSDLTIDHIHPLILDGEPFSEENLQILCRSCNSSKKAKLIQ